MSQRVKLKELEKAELGRLNSRIKKTLTTIITLLFSANIELRTASQNQ